MKKQTLLLTGLASALLVAGCTSSPAIDNQGRIDPQPAMINHAASKTLKHAVGKTGTASLQSPIQAPQAGLIKITGIGYGSEGTYDGFTAGQRSLMAIRASKLDAYRSLAEQLYGIKIDSNTSVFTLTAKNDSFRARVNAIVHGARLVSVTPMPNKNYETVLEVYVDKAFFKNAFTYSEKPRETNSLQ